MGIFEKVAFTVCLPVIAPIAAAIATHEKITKGTPFFDSDSQKSVDENDAIELIKQKSKEKQAAEERESILTYAKDGLITLQSIHSSAQQPINISLNFQQLKTAIQSTEKPIEILSRFIPQILTNDTTVDINRLNEEISDLQKWRQVVLDILPEGSAHD